MSKRLVIDKMMFISTRRYQVRPLQPTWKAFPLLHMLSEP